ncbi:methyltransferase domain-containing protein [Undibacterium cyanobacteriorum]|uniref:Methyltransferase domain-containing protein n=1 Tax=Undibacterium cyanobacteriorum TaxID=3073561 RepID=A0ABY9RME5_9BURK|nr:methyltransferase domain-containing protein [Undibacterium sp. 20NA77.5]WMW82373.1 methyltransferase domain-containing protein [Undibacterium sp. 20NA77.5]
MLIKRKSIEAESNYRSGPRAEQAHSTKSRKPKFAPITLSELDGVRYLHFGTEWIQGAMRLRKPDWLELEYAQQMMAWMLFHKTPRHVAQLGLGTGALTKFCYREFPDCQVTAVDINPAVIAICESMFKLPPNDARLHVMEMDAMDYVCDSEHHNTLHALQVDLYDATAKGPVLDSSEFYQACADCLHPDGILTVNLFGDHPSFAKNLKVLKFVFGTVLCFPPVHDGNVVAIAFKARLKLDEAILRTRAEEIQNLTKLPAHAWLDGLLASQA